MFKMTPPTACGVFVCRIKTSEECVHLTKILYSQVFLSLLQPSWYVFSHSNTAKYGKMLIKAPLQKVLWLSKHPNCRCSILRNFSPKKLLHFLYEHLPIATESV